MKMAPVTRSGSTMVRKLNLLHQARSDAQYIQKVNRSFRSAKIVLGVAIEKTNLCFHCYQPHEREIPQRKLPSRQTSQVKTCTCPALMNVESICNAHRTGPHANEMDKLVTSLNQTVDEFNILKREQRRLKSLPRQKCKYCKKWFTLDPCDYYRQYCKELAKIKPSKMENELSQGESLTRGSECFRK